MNKEPDNNIKISIHTTVIKETPRCVDCKYPLPKGFVYRCPACYDEMWFPR